MAESSRTEGNLSGTAKTARDKTGDAEGVRRGRDEPPMFCAAFKRLPGKREKGGRAGRGVTSRVSVASFEVDAERGLTLES